MELMMKTMWVQVLCWPPDPTNNSIYACLLRPLSVTERIEYLVI